MTVDPVLKQDLMLIKEAFENGSLGQDGEATWVPVRSMISNSRQVHQSILLSVARYPSAYAASQDSKQSLLDRIQDECIPCADRIKALRDCDIGIDIDDSLIQYNANILNELTNFFKFFEGISPIESNVCEIYKGFRSQCVPDLRRVVLALTFLLTDIRQISMKALSTSFLEVVLALIGNLVVNITVSFDQFAQLITNTLKCILQDVREQLAKVEPILKRGATQSGEPQGIDRTSELLQEAWKGAEADKEWLANTARNRPTYNEVPFSGQFDQLTADVQAGFDKIPTVSLQADVGGLIQNVISKAITRVDGNLQVSQNELLKILKSAEGNFHALNELVFQVQTIIGLLNVLEGIIESRSDFDPCTRESDERFFLTLRLPRRRVTVTRVPTEGPDDVNVDIIPDTTSVDNPIVQDILENAGIDVVEVEDPSGSGERRLEVAAPTVSVSLTKCLGA